MERVSVTSGDDGDRVWADAHVHLYPEFSLNAAVACSSRFPHAGARACLLTERADCDFFETLRALPEVTETSDGAVKVGGVWWIAGRQVATAERLEILALCTQSHFQDGLPFFEALQQVRESGAVSVTPWGAGKWWFGRGELIGAAIEAARPGELLLADSSLRPRGAVESSLFRLARQRGLGIIAGTDPLPFAGQEQLIGTYGCIIPGFDPKVPAASIRAALQRPGVPFEHFGERSSFLTVAERLFKTKLAKMRLAHDRSNRLPTS